MNTLTDSGFSSKVHRAPTFAQGRGGVASSVLATGRWAKIRVPESGVFQITDELIRKAGFSDINKVKVYGYGGNLCSRRTICNRPTTCRKWHNAFRAAAGCSTQKDP